MLIRDFETEHEYAAFKIWAQNGSTIGQRMSRGEPREFPEYWHDYKKVLDIVGEYPESIAELDKLMKKYAD